MSVFIHMKTQQCRLRLLLIILLVALGNTFAYAQKKKALKKMGVKTIVVTETNGTKTLTDSKSYFDHNGRLTEEINYDSLGNFKNHVKYIRNIKGDVVEELVLDKEGKTAEKRVLKYNKLAQKTEELIYNKDNLLKLKHAYVYDKNGLKTERKTFDSKGILISSKKYTYLFN